jgi:hypothetical protein
MARMSVQQAAVTAFVAYLTVQLVAVFGEGKVLVEDRFPEAGPPMFDKTLRRRVTVICAGEREDLFVQANVVRAKPISSSEKVRMGWRMKACRQPLQLDLWATTSVELQELMAEVDVALHQGPGVTLGLTNADPVRDGVLLALNPDTGHEGFTDVFFEGPSIVNDGAEQQQRECRAMYRGALDVDLVVEAISPTMARIKLRETIDGITTTYTLEPKSVENRDLVIKGSS